ncbi:alpha-L-iduronidase [Aethina tumida]|uniref:alpha-L-iduronidase n=1 Tax=Aethina tumida TaxID=116153 RepID=UPI002147780F|nr:alpha-L-iduronidase [Aethina tumida]
MQYLTQLAILTALIIKSGHSIQYHYNVEIDAGYNGGRLKQFWKSTGLCPPDPKQEAYKFLLGEDEKINLALIGSLPNKGIRHVRIHWLLNLITQTDATHSYNFKYLDNLIDHLTKYNLRPGFELMGHPITLNPRNATYKSNINWAALAEQIAVRYLDKYGSRQLKRWRFETWNEPDLKSYNIYNFTLGEYLSYVDGCFLGLKTAFSKYSSLGNLKLGGPAGLFRDPKYHPLCWGLLKHCNKVGTTKCPVQFFSFHRKGDGTPQGHMNASLQLLDQIYDEFPNLRKMRIANDESDLLKTWSRAEEWRADVRYAANVVKVIADYYKSVRLDRKWKIEVVSNDNAFLNYHPFYFTQRTLFARFQMNRTHPPHRQFIKKPVYGVMGMLSFLKGENIVKKDRINHDPFLTVLATRNQGRRRQSSISILMSFANGTQINDEYIGNVTVSINNLPEQLHGPKYVVYILDNEKTNPYAVWRTMGKPVFPDLHTRNEMRNVEEPLLLRGPTEFNSVNINISVLMSIPSVALIHLCTHGDNYPGTVYSINVFNVTRSEVLLTWKYNQKNSQCIRTYEVEQAIDCPGNSPTEFQRVNVKKDTVFLSYHHFVRDDGGCEKTRGWYRIRAVDYWDRAGSYSETVYYPESRP